MTSRATPERVDRIVSNHIKQYRIKKHLSQGQLGDRLGVTFQQIQKYEKGSNSIATGRVRDLCRILGISPNTLFGWGQENPASVEALPSNWAVRMSYQFDKIPVGCRSAVSQLVELLAALKE